MTPPARLQTAAMKMFADLAATSIRGHGVWKDWRHV